MSCSCHLVLVYLSDERDKLLHEMQRMQATQSEDDEDAGEEQELQQDERGDNGEQADEQLPAHSQPPDGQRMEAEPDSSPRTPVRRRAPASTTPPPQSSLASGARRSGRTRPSTSSAAMANAVDDDELDAVLHLLSQPANRVRRDELKNMSQPAARLYEALSQRALRSDAQRSQHVTFTRPAVSRSLSVTEPPLMSPSSSRARPSSSRLRGQAQTAAFITSDPVDVFSEEEEGEADTDDVEGDEDQHPGHMEQLSRVLHTVLTRQGVSPKLLNTDVLAVATATVGGGPFEHWRLHCSHLKRE